MYGRRLLLTLLLSAAIHVVVPFLVPRQPHAPAAPRKAPPRPVPVAVYQQRTKALEDQQKAEAQKPPEPKPEPPKEPPKPRPDAPKPPREPPKEAPPPPKPDAPPPAPEPPAPRKPAPFVLNNVALNGGVAVQTGEASNLFGDPTQDAKGFRKGSDAPRGPEGTGGGGDAPARKVVVKPPEALNSVKGTYPDQHRDLGRVVRVELLLSVDPAGQVVDAKVRKGDLPAFDEEALRTARKLRFRPATRDGVPIPYEVKWTVVFLPEG